MWSPYRGKLVFQCLINFFLALTCLIPYLIPSKGGKNASTLHKLQKKMVPSANQTQHASQLPLQTPSEHFSALSCCHTSQKTGCVGQRVSSLQKTKPSAKLPARAPHPANGVRTQQLGCQNGKSRPSVRG